MHLLCILFFMFSFFAGADPLCNNANVNQVIKNITNLDLDIRERDKDLTLLMESCSREQIEDFILNLMIHLSKLEWSLQKKIIQWIQTDPSKCEPMVVDYLWSSIQSLSAENYYILEDIVWVLSDTVRGNRFMDENQMFCDDQVIHLVSKFIQADNLSMELSDFRAQVILPLLAVMVRIGIKNDNMQAAEELKNIALNHSVSDYFRSAAVESLQFLAMYVPYGLSALHAVIREISMRYISKAVLEIRADELIRNHKDQLVRAYAYQLLKKLVITQTSQLLSFIFLPEAKLNKYDRYWKQTAKGLALPKGIQKQALEQMKQLSEDSKISVEYQNKAMRVLSFIQ